MKKQYYKLALKHHPDRVHSDNKKAANDQFNIIHQAYSILSSPEKKRKYDDGLDIFFSKATVSAHWESHLTIIEKADIERVQKNYQGSKKEEEEITREFIRGNGSLTHLMNTIPFMRVEDEARIVDIVKQLMNNGKLKSMKIKKLPKSYNV